MKRIILPTIVILLLASCGGKNTPSSGREGGKNNPEKVTNYVAFLISEDLEDEYKTLFLFIDAKPEDRKNVWIDKNENGKKDSGEEITKFGLHYDKENELKFTAKKELRLHGKVTHLAGRTNFRFSKFTSGVNKDLTYLDLSTNFMKEIDISGLSNLQYLSLRNNVIEKLDLTKFHKLKVLDLGYTNYFSTVLDNCTDLEYLDLSARYYSGFSMKHFTKLRTLIVRNNELEEFDVSTLTGLEGLDLTGNRMKKDALEKLYKSLPNRRGLVPGVLLIKGNPGAVLANHQLAQDRNWQVDDTSERLRPGMRRDNLPIVKW